MEIDWEKLWLDARKNRPRKKRKESGPEQWDKRADDYADMVKRNDYDYGRKVMGTVMFQMKVGHYM